MPQLKVSLGIGFANAHRCDTLNIDDAEWKECATEEEREELIDEYATQWAWGYIDIGAEVVE